MPKLIIIGGGAAGMAAAIFAAESGARVELFEKNDKTGKKLFITGKGRCNFTNVCGRDELLENTVTNARFMYSAFSEFGSSDAIGFFEKIGVKTKVERGQRAFPLSDHSSDIISALNKRMKALGVSVHLNSEVKELIFDESTVSGVILDNGSRVYADSVIVATGGLSYPSTGSTGDGYRFASDCGLRVTSQRPALVPLESPDEYVKRLQGLSLKNVTLTIKEGKKVLYSDFGEMLFTHFGISGPLVLSASSLVAKRLEKVELEAYIDLKPALTAEQLDARLVREFSENKNKQFKNSLSALFPSKLIPVMIEKSGIDPEKQVNNITKGQRNEFVRLIKALKLTIKGTRPFNEAIITQGGVSVKDIDPSEMKAKKLDGLYFAGEVLDVDAFTGGFNLQIAWSTAYKAARAAAHINKENESEEN